MSFSALARLTADPSLLQEASPKQNSTHHPVDELEYKLAALQKDYADLHAAVFDAAEVHRRLCAPRLLQFGDFEIASEVFAVRHLPGDFFTVAETDDGVVFALGDICGKGLAAGMWTTHLIGLIAIQTAKSSQPHIIVTGINNDLGRVPSAPLASLFLAKLDPTTGRLDYCSAGHPPALLLRASGEIESLSDGGPLLGVVDTASFVAGRVELGADDVLLVYSDGILESRDFADQEFGSDRIQAQLRHSKFGPADAVLFSMLGAVQDFAGACPLADDTSLVVVRRKEEKAVKR
jgi:sigma-B regulation protein RsbU (phosphoserine phosphatase)